jgi:hypothetical protein
MANNGITFLSTLEATVGRNETSSANRHVGNLDAANNNNSPVTTGDVMNDDVTTNDVISHFLNKSAIDSVDVSDVVDTVGVNDGVPVAQLERMNLGQRVSAGLANLETNL